MKRSINVLFALALALACALQVTAAPAVIPAKPADPYFEGFDPKPAPEAEGLALRQGDRLAICGDSITEQRMYSRIMETYLTACAPQLGVTVRQYGWSGETAPGFLHRMTNDCLRFKPTIATTCYGMNDHRYRPYEPEIGETYKRYQTAIVEAFQSNGVRVILGSAGCVGRMPTWVKGTNGTVHDLNVNLCTLRNLDVEIAEQHRTGFADVFWPMFSGRFEAQQRLGTNFAMAGKDGVHPGWAGHLIMAYAFLKGLGLQGDIGSIQLDLATGQAEASAGHRIVSAQPQEIQIESTRYPFCAAGPTNEDSSIRAGMTFVPFNKELNRFTLSANNGTARSYKVSWGANSRIYTASQLAAGVNLADDFAINPFAGAFAKVDKAVAAKQAYETKQIKEAFHGLAGKKSAEEVKDPELHELYALRTPDGKLDKDAVAQATEKKRVPLAAAIKEAFVPVTHTIRIDPL